jgi:hypothetical protein
MGEHILLINYDFPPNQGIGGRRWGKLAKGLAKQGYIVHVIKSQAIPGNKPSPWSSDVTHPNIQVTTLPRTYPAVISHTGKSFWDKLHYRFAIWRLKRAVKGTIYDLSAEWGKPLIAACERLCTDFPIKRIIATGAPWHMLYEVGEWNRTRFNLQYIIDFRDPWLHAKNYGMADLDAPRKAFEAHKQERALALADVVLSPDPAILEELKAFAHHRKTSTGRLFVLRHFYDEDDFTQLADAAKSSNDTHKFTIVYGGDLYQDMQPELRDVVSFFEENSRLNPHVELHIYTDARVPDFIRDVAGIRIFPSAGKSFYSIAREAHALLILLPKHKNHEFTTKFYDYMPLHKPYIVASQGGLVADFVVENQMGYIWKSTNQYPWFENLRSDSFNFQPKYDISAFSLTSATKQLTTLFT